MKTILLTTVLTFTLFGQAKAPEPPKLSDAVLVQYWHAIAAHHAQTASLQASMTVKQKQIQDAITEIDKQIEEVRQKLVAACGDKATLDETGAEPVCKAKEKEKEK